MFKDAAYGLLMSISLLADLSYTWISFPFFVAKYFSIKIVKQIFLKITTEVKRGSAKALFAQRMGYIHYL